MHPRAVGTVLPRDVAQGFVVALASANATQETAWLHDLATADDVPAEGGPLFHPAVAAQVAATINDLIDEYGVTSETLAQIAVQIRDTPALCLPQLERMTAVRQAWLNRRLAAEAAYVIVSNLALEARLIDVPYPRRHLIEALSAEGGADLFRIAAHLRVTPRRHPPRPLVVLLTPLTQVVSDAAQADLLDVAFAIRDALPPEAAQVMIPGETLHPSARVDNHPADLYFRERSILLRASLVVVIAGAHDSWGAACATAWCEANGSQVIILVDNPDRISRVLGSGPFATEVVPELHGAQAASLVAERFEERRTALAAHAADLWRTDRRVDTARIGPGTEVNRSRARLRPAARLEAAMRSARELDSLTIREARELLRTGDPTARKRLELALDLDLAGPGSAGAARAARTDLTAAEVDEGA